MCRVCACWCSCGSAWVCMLVSLVPPVWNPSSAGQMDCIRWIWNDCNSMCLCSYVCVCVYECLWVYLFVGVSVCVCVCVCMYVWQEVKWPPGGISEGTTMCQLFILDSNFKNRILSWPLLTTTVTLAAMSWELRPVSRQWRQGRGLKHQSGLSKRGWGVNTTSI